MILEKTIPLGINLKNSEPYRVMLADNSRLERLLLRKFLLHEKFKIVAETEGGQETVDVFQKLTMKPDILCLDFEFPDKNGVKVIEEIRRTHPHLVIIMVTKNTHRVLIQKISELRINAFLVKPVSRLQILEKLSYILGRSELSKTKKVMENKGNLNLNEIVIPPLKTVAAKVLLFDSQATAGSAELDKIIAPDKGLSSDILRIANSSFYGRKGNINTLKDAITLMGVKMVKSLVFLRTRNGLHSNLKNEVYQKHLQELPVLTALISYDLATPLGYKKLRDELFLASLLYKIGMTILAINNEKKYAEVLKLSQIGVKDLYEIEKEELNLSSLEISIKAFRLWSMPKLYQDVTTNQNFKISDIPYVTDTDKIIRLSDILSKKMIQLYVSENEENILNRLYSHYKMGEETQKLFGEDYYIMIKEHPFYEMAMSV
ncbi:MAG: HDOD domain-containing protein [Leptospiraceae bacterium]|nr:HDOD domain-containing protein [Leptospiraceae bacterium]